MFTTLPSIGGLIKICPPIYYEEHLKNRFFAHPPSIHLILKLSYFKTATTNSSWDHQNKEAQIIIFAFLLIDHPSNCCFTRTIDEHCWTIELIIKTYFSYNKYLHLLLAKANIITKPLQLLLKLKDPSSCKIRRTQRRMPKNGRLVV